MADNPNLAQLKAAYAVWDQFKGQRTDVWLDLVADDMRLISMGEHTSALAFAVPRRSKQEVVAYFTALLADWQMIHWTPETYVCEGDHIAVFGRSGWTNKATGKIAEIRIAHLWTFSSGKAVELIELFDSARAAAAAMPG